MNKSTLHLTTRRPNGQIGYISENLSIPEFFDLIRSKGDVNVFVDCSPVISALHDLKKSSDDEGIRNDYNHLFNFWQESKAYKKESIKESKALTTSELSSALINKFHARLQESKNIFYSESQDIGRQSNIVRSIKADCDLYINTLLCYIHSKALLEIESFRLDFVIVSYGEFLRELVSDLYGWLLNRYGCGDSFFNYLAFHEKNYAELDLYLGLEQIPELSDGFILRTVKNQESYRGQNQHDYERMISIEFQNYNHYFLGMIETMRDLVYKSRSICGLISRLKEGGIVWNDDEEFSKDLIEKIVRIPPRR